MIRQTNEVPFKTRICEFADSLPASSEQKNKLIQKYQPLKGYEFLNPKSKLHKHFNHKYHLGIELRNRQFDMNNEVKIAMQGNLEQISVGAMCEFVNQNIRKGADPYQPITHEQYHQQFLFARDQDLFAKTVNLLHALNLAKHDQKHKETSHPSSTSTNNALDKIAEYRKQMTVREDGSMGAWGGKKYQGLGSQNQFTNFRREQSMSYYQNSHPQGGERKKI